MTSLPEQLSVVRTAQLEAQFDLFRSLTTQALDSASKVVALNLSASRDSVERSSNAVRQLFSATNPRDLLELRSHAEEQFRSMVSYSRELFSIASSVQAYGVLPQAASPATPPAPVAAPVPAPAPVAEVDTAATVAAIERAVAGVTEPVAKAAAEATEPVVEAVSEANKATVAVVEKAAEKVAETASAPAATLEAFVQEHVVSDEPAVVAEPVEAIAEPAPVAPQKPIAKAAGNGEPKAAVVPHPAAAPVVAAEDAPAPKIEVTRSKRRK